MTSEESKALVVAAWKVFATRDPTRIGALFAEDAEWKAPDGNATALALKSTAHLVGRARIAHFIGVEFGTLFCRDVAVDLRRVFADGDSVVVEMRLGATLAHGGAYDNEYCFVFELRDGLIWRVREYMDTARGLRQMLAVA